VEREDAELAQELQSYPRWLLPERLVAAARQRTGGAAALYVPDIGGGELRRVAGDGELPSVLPGSGGVGPELDAEAIDRLRVELRGIVPAGRVEPLWLVDRAVAVLVAVAEGDDGGDGLRRLARAAAPVFELIIGYTDVVERARRSRPTSPAAEVQLGLLPPRVATVDGGTVVGSILPAYDVGGDWFDHAANAEGTWLAVADAMGKGARAAALAALAIGALRATHAGRSALRRRAARSAPMASAARSTRRCSPSTPTRS